MFEGRALPGLTPIRECDDGLMEINVGRAAGGNVKHVRCLPAWVLGECRTEQEIVLENMVSMRSMMLMLVPPVALGACSAGLNEDRALLTSASQNAEQAKQQSAQALAASQAAQRQAQAAAAAKSANEKSDRMFQKSLRE